MGGHSYRPGDQGKIKQKIPSPYPATRRTLDSERGFARQTVETRGQRTRTGQVVSRKAGGRKQEEAAEKEGKSEHHRYLLRPMTQSCRAADARPEKQRPAMANARRLGREAERTANRPAKGPFQRIDRRYRRRRKAPRSLKGGARHAGLPEREGRPENTEAPGEESAAHHFRE